MQQKLVEKTVGENPGLEKWHTEFDQAFKVFAEKLENAIHYRQAESKSLYFLLSVKKLLYKFFCSFSFLFIVYLGGGFHLIFIRFHDFQHSPFKTFSFHHLFMI